jgi:eukaryotic-like serine/threonine-protein kinase
VPGDERSTSDGDEAQPHAKLALLSLDERTLAATNDEDDDEDDDDAAVTRERTPERVGRYLVLAKLGAGAMGVVYAAYDPDLDRKLALKLLHDDDQPERRTLRLLREAQALARVSHPNVISVYDVGTFDDRVYIAMEYVDGVSLSAWLTAEKRPLAELLAVFSKAGHGLAAAHDKGLVHRDFKPDNVLVARDGRVVVLDFGIAHAAAGAEPRAPDDAVMRRHIEEHSAAHRLAGMSALDNEVTRAGSLVGTPAYMSPEQLEGRRTDERSDQFSFCVALWEAVHGERPFPGESPLALWRSMRDGALREPASARVPKPIQRALVRGLALDPERRFPTMAALLDELDRDRAIIRKRVLVAIVAIAAFGFLIGRSATRPRVAPICDGAAQRLAGTWDEGRRNALAQAFSRPELPLAAQALPVVRDGLDRYADEWRSMYTDACEATHVRREQSEQLLDRRMACLDERRLALDALVEVLLEPDAIVVEHAHAAVAALPPIESCANRRMLEAQVAPPDRPGLAELVESIERELSLARARREAGDPQRALSIAREAESRAAATAYAPIQAAASIEVGRSYKELGEFEQAAAKLREGFYQALSAGDEQACVAAATALVQVTGDQQRDFEAAANWARIADALLDRRGDQRSRARVELEFQAGVVHWRQGELEQARAELETALALAQALGPDERLLEVRVRKGLGSTLWSLGKADEAAAQFQLVVDTLAGELGPDHPEVGSAINNLASAQYTLGHLELALAGFERALQIYEGSHGDEHPSVANSLNNLAVVHTKLGELDRARDTHLRVLGIYERTLGAEHLELATTWINLGRVLRLLGELEAAADYYQRAYERREAALGADHSETMIPLGGLALTQIDLGLHDEGLANFERVLATQRRLLGDDHPKVAEVEQDLGWALVELGRPRDGEGLLRSALATRERELPAAHPDLARTLADLARAVLASGRAREAGELLERFLAIETAARSPAPLRARVRLDRARVQIASRDHEAARESAIAGLALLESSEEPKVADLRRELDDILARARKRR